MLQAFRRDRRRNTAEFFFETAEGQDQSPPFVGNFGATAMRTASASAHSTAARAAAEARPASRGVTPRVSAVTVSA